MKTCYVLLLILFIFSCQSRTTPRNSVSDSKEIVDNINVIKFQGETNDDEDIISKTILKCGDKVFTLVVRYKDDSKSIDLLEDKTVKNTINLPNQNEVNGFSLNQVKETKEGFGISIEYGSRLYYQKNFDFVCKQNSFYLREVKITSFDKHNPDSSWKETSRIINPKLPIEKFLVADFLRSN